MSHIKTLVSKRTGNKSYRVFIKSPNQKTITKTFKLKKDALTFSRTIEGNANIHDALTSPLLNKTFSELLDKYPNEKSRLKYFIDHFGDYKLNQIKKSHIVSALDKLTVAPATVNRYRNDIGSFAKWINESLNDAKWNPHHGITRKTEPQSRQDYLSIHQQKELLKQAKLIDSDKTQYECSPTKKLYLYLLIALSLGCRKGEIEAFRWNDIEWQDEVIIVRGVDAGASKTGRRELPLSPTLLKELTRHRAVGNGLLFPSIDDPSKPYVFRKQWQNCRKNAGIKDSFVFHSLRHTTASNMAKSGQSLMQIGVILGHKSAPPCVR